LGLFGVSDLGSGINPGFGLFGKIPQSFDKVLPVFVVIDDPALFNPQEDNMVKGSGGIEPRLAGHKTSFRVFDFRTISSIP